MKKNIIYSDEKYYVEIIPLSGRDLGLRTNLTINESKSNNTIKDIGTLENNWVLSVGEYLDINLAVNGEYFKTQYKVDSISKSIDNRYDYIISSEDYNKANKFLTPVLGRTKSFFCYDSYFINCFLRKDNRSLLLKYRFSKSDAYGRLEERLKTHDSYLTFYDYDRYTVLFSFRIPDIFIEDVNSFKEGKYSQFSNRLKNNINIFFDLKKDGILNQILTKSNNLKQQLELDLGVELSTDIELESKPDLKQEVWTEPLNTETSMKNYLEKSGTSS